MADLKTSVSGTDSRKANRSLNVGIIELLTDRRYRTRMEGLYATYLTKQYVSIAPQAVAVWCRQLGHKVHYATYYGQADPRSLLPADLDIVFVSTHTRTSALAYALAKLWRRNNVLTVVGGPHSKSFPLDCVRFFDLAVLECDKALIADILSGQFDRPAIVSSGKPFSEIPSVEERMPEISASVFNRGHRTKTTLVPMLTSMGCPYSCDFCMDWAHKYEPLPEELLEADLNYLSDTMSDVLIGFHDPNFGVRFDKTMDILERIPKDRRNPYVMESSLANMKESRMPRLKETNCVFIAPGVESWSDYSHKAGAGSKRGRDKLEEVIAHFEQLKAYVPGFQANFLFGLDCDQGREPVELTKEFIRRSPGVWPAVNIPIPLCGTPLFETMHKEGRVLRNMPFALYFKLQYTVTTIKNYHPIEFYDHMVDIYSTIGSVAMLAKRVLARGHPFIRFLNAVRTLDDRRDIREFKAVRDQLVTDKQFLAFHEGKPVPLPEFYHQRFEERLGDYAHLISRDERVPVIEPFTVPTHDGSIQISL